VNAIVGVRALSGRRAVKPDATDFLQAVPKLLDQYLAAFVKLTERQARLSRPVGAAASEAIKFTAAAAPAIPS
jgi:hypothetical protein